MSHPHDDADPDETVELEETIEITLPVQIDLAETVDDISPPDVEDEAKEGVDEPDEFDTIDPEAGVQPVNEPSDPLDTWEDDS